MGGRLSCCNSSSSSSSLTEDMLFEILVCLPVKSLLRFKSVCKSWLSLIESSEFIHRHAITVPRTDKNNILATFIFHYGRPNDPHRVLSWNMFSVTSDHKSKIFNELPMQPYYRNPKDRRKVLIVGCCNGLICLQDQELRDVSLWNPAINQFRILPKQLTTFDGISTDNLEVYKDFAAFGFDVETKDYKVVLVTYFGRPYIYDTQYPYRVQVYSLSTDSWRPLEDLVMPTHPDGGELNGTYHGVYLNGSYYGFGEELIGKELYYIGGTSFNRRIMLSSLLSFDFTKEIFRTTQLPDAIDFTKDITFLDEKIAIFEAYYRCVWVLNEPGVKESWTKLYTLTKIDSLSNVPLERIGISNNGEYVFIFDSDSGKIKMINPSTLESHVVKGLPIVEYYRYNGLTFKAVVYRRSLVPVSGTQKSSGTVVKFFKTPYYIYLCASHGPCFESLFELLDYLLQG